MKTKEELDALREEVKVLNAKLAELSGDELKQVTGGSPYAIYSCPRGLVFMEAAVCKKCDMLHTDGKGIGTCDYLPGRIS